MSCKSQKLDGTADRVAVVFHDGETVEARVLSSSQLADTALLEFAPPRNDISVAMLRDSSKLEVGEEIVVALVAGAAKSARSQPSPVYQEIVASSLTSLPSQALLLYLYAMTSAPI